MKIKKPRESALSAVKSIVSKAENTVPTLFTMDTSGYLTIEGFKKLNDYTEKLINVSTGQKLFYVHGEKLNITSCNKHNIVINGNISSLEIFEVK